MKYRIGQFLGFLWFAALTALLAGGLLFWWLSDMRPKDGDPPSTNIQESVCIIWKDLGKPCA